MNIDSIQNGIVIDHIQAGNSMNLYHHLRLDECGCTVAIIQNCKSAKMGRKDILKIDDTLDVNLDVLGYIDPGVTVSYVRGGQTVEKRKLQLPQRLVNVVRCKNPRCITTTEPGLDQAFRLCDAARKLYRCEYCDTAFTG